MKRICLILLLFPVFSACESTPKNDEPIPDDEIITIPPEDPEPIATFVFDTRRIIAADYIRIELTSQFFESKMGSTRDLVFPVYELVAYISSIMTLEPGDVVLTGTPSGVGPLLEGDEVSVEIEGIGKLTNRVRTENFPE